MSALVRDDGAVADQIEDDEQEHTGGMIALLPDAESAANLAVDADGAEDPADLHMTIAYLGDDVADMDQATRQTIMAGVSQQAASLGPVTADVMSHAMFNPNGGEHDPATVYLATGAQLASVRDALADHDTSDHPMWLPHVTAGYGLDPGELSYTGPITFDRLRVALGGQHYDFPLSGVNAEEDTDVEDVDDPNDPDAEDMEKKGTPAGFEEKVKVASDAGVARYGLPIGTELGQARDKNAQAAQDDPEAQKMYADLIKANPRDYRAMLDKLTPDQLHKLSQITYSSATSNATVTQGRLAIASALRRRGEDVNDHGGLGKSKPGSGQAKPGSGKEALASQGWDPSMNETPKKGKSGGSGTSSGGKAKSSGSGSGSSGGSGKAKSSGGSSSGGSSSGGSSSGKAKSSGSGSGSSGSSAKPAAAAAKPASDAPRNAAPSRPNAAPPPPPGGAPGIVETDRDGRPTGRTGPPQGGGPRPGPTPRPGRGSVDKRGVGHGEVDGKEWARLLSKGWKRGPDGRLRPPPVDATPGAATSPTGQKGAHVADDGLDLFDLGVEVKQATTKPGDTRKAQRVGKTIGAAKSDEKGGGDEYPVKTIGDLAAGVKRAKAIKDPERRKEVMAHLRKGAKAIGGPAVNMVPSDDAAAKPGKSGGGFVPFKKGGKKDAIEAEWLENLDAYELHGLIQEKVMSPDPHAAKLREYWAHGAGRAKWNPGSEGDFYRLRRHLSKYVPEKMLNGLTANIHKLATGTWPGKAAHGAKSGEPEDMQYKALSPADLAAAAALDNDDEVDPLDDDDAVSVALNAYGQMASEITSEEAYEDALAQQVDWSLLPDGTLEVDPDIDDAGRDYATGNITGSGMGDGDGDEDDEPAEPADVMAELFA